MRYVLAVLQVMWRPDLGAWLDWDLKNHKHREYFFVSNLVPLWTESYDAPKKIVADLVLKYLRDNGVINSDNKMLYKGNNDTGRDLHQKR